MIVIPSMNEDELAELRLCIVDAARSATNKIHADELFAIRGKLEFAEVRED